MFDQLHYNQENSLDILLKFSTESQNHQSYNDYQFETDQKDIPSTNNKINSLISLLVCPLDEPNIEADRDIAQMKKAADQQEQKMKDLIKHKNKDRPKIQIGSKRKISECTQAPNSPLRKTKALRKDKA